MANFRIDIHSSPFHSERDQKLMYVLPPEGSISGHYFLFRWNKFPGKMINLNLTFQRNLVILNELEHTLLEFFEILSMNGSPATFDFPRAEAEVADMMKK